MEKIEKQELSEEGEVIDKEIIKAIEELREPENTETDDKFAEAWYEQHSLLSKRGLSDEIISSRDAKLFAEILHYQINKSSASERNKELAHKLVDLKTDMHEEVQKSNLKGEEGVETYRKANEQFEVEKKKMVTNYFRDDFTSWLKDRGEIEKRYESYKDIQLEKVYYTFHRRNKESQERILKQIKDGFAYEAIQGFMGKQADVKSTDLISDKIIKIADEKWRRKYPASFYGSGYDNFLRNTILGFQPSITILLTTPEEMKNRIKKTLEEK
jgi:hypothetical protein